MNHHPTHFSESTFEDYAVLQEQLATLRGRIASYEAKTAELSERQCQVLHRWRENLVEIEMELLLRRA